LQVNAKTMPKTFLTADWRHLAMLNYEVDAALIQKHVPNGTELDRWNGKLFVSLVGFMFLNTRVRGLAIPFHRNFEEVNLRFYVRRQTGDEVRRGVVFIKEIVPRWAIAMIARVVYNENYVAMPMRHSVTPQLNETEGSGSKEPDVATPVFKDAVTADYGWRWRDRWNQIKLSTAGQAAMAVEGSEEQFITEHYWGYAAQPDGGCMEYRVEHPSWRVWQAATASFEGDMEELYGRDLAQVVLGKPSSAFLADGSAVQVMQGTKI
jgi:uncharacterized protein